MGETAIKSSSTLGRGKQRGTGQGDYETMGTGYFHNFQSLKERWGDAFCSTSGPVSGPVRAKKKVKKTGR